MRDTDCDLTSVDRGAGRLAGHRVGRALRGRRVATGAVDSPQATLIPLGAPARGRARRRAATSRCGRFDVGVGLHGDHIGGERDAARALVAGEVDAACMIDGNHLRSRDEGTLPAGRDAGRRPDRAVRPLQHDGRRRCARAACATFGELLLAMSYADPDVRPLLDLEGLKEWLPGAHVGLRRARARGRRGRLLRRRRRDHRCRLSTLTSRTSASTGARTSSSTARWPASRPATASRCAAPTRRSRCTSAPGAARHGHALEPRRDDRELVVVRGRAGERPLGAARRAPAVRRPVARRAEPAWGLAARGALVEAGGPEPRFDLDERRTVWADIAPRLYAQAVAAPVGPGDRDRLGRAVRAARRRRGRGRAGDDVPDRERAGRAGRPGPFPRPDPPALPRGHAAPRHAGRRRGAPRRGVHPAGPLLRRDELGVSGAGGRASLQTLLDEPDFTLAGFLLSVLGEGTFLEPAVASSSITPPTRSPARSRGWRSRTRPATSRSGSRTSSRPCASDPAMLGRLRGRGRTPPRRAGVDRRAQRRASSTRSSCSRRARGRRTRSRAGWRAVLELQADMDEGRRRRLVRLGFPARRGRRAVRAAHPQLHVALGAAAAAMPAAHV